MTMQWQFIIRHKITVGIGLNLVTAFAHPTLADFIPIFRLIHIEIFFLNGVLGHDDSPVLAENSRFCRRRIISSRGAYGMILPRSITINLSTRSSIVALFVTRILFLPFEIAFRVSGRRISEVGSSDAVGSSKIRAGGS